MYIWGEVDTSELKFLPVLKSLFTESTVFVWGQEQVDRIALDGIATLKGNIGTLEVGVIYNDFRVNGGSFGQAASLRVTSFIKELTKNNTPLIFIFNTIGLRIMEGRTTFDDAFSIIPALLEHKKTAPFFTLSLGLTLGIGAILFRLGHYRIAVENESYINLTGPEVIKKFFGQELDFESIASARNQFVNSSLIQEIVPTKEAAATKIKNFLLFTQQDVQITNYEPRSFGEYIGSCAIEHLNTPEKNIKKVLNYFNGSSIEVFNQLNPLVRTFIAKHHGQLLGVLVNPPGNPNNMLTAASLQRYQYALDLFESLKLPIISFLDTAGIDPRTQNYKDKDIISEFANTTQKIIDYPFSKMGFFCGRGYGGANVLGIPKIYGAAATYAIEGSKIGIMHPSLIESLLSGSPRLLEKWRQAHEKETDDLADLIAKGTIDAVVREADVSGIISNFMVGAQVKNFIKANKIKRHLSRAKELDDTNQV